MKLDISRFISLETVHKRFQNQGEEVVQCGLCG